MKRFLSCAVALIFVAVFQMAAAGNDISSDVVAIDHDARQLSVAWHNDTTKVVHWNPETKITVLETGDKAKAAAIHVGSYLRIKGEEKDGKFIAAEIEIWEAAESMPQSL